MALALLCSKIQAELSHSLSPVNFRAFVVDHGVRSESSSEAQSVASVLATRSIPTSILKIQWPKGLDAKLAPNFETLARQYRFQALGKACREHGINDLFVAHHSDDQAETVLMRLINGHGKLGLEGIKSSAPIPECHGIFGVGGDAVHVNEHDEVLEVVKGVTIHRPLLNMSKEALRELCEKDGMQWFEDKTNADPSLTMRNAVRHIVSNHTLPEALQKPSLLAMVDSIRSEREQEEKTGVEDWARKLQVISYDRRFPYLKFTALPLINQEQVDWTTIPTLLKLLRNLLVKVSNIKHIELPALNSLLPHIFPELGLRREVNGIKEPLKDKLTMAGVQFTRVKGEEESGTRSRTWELVPAKAYRGRTPVLVFPPKPDGGDSNSGLPNDWVLYESRYWIKVENRTGSNVQLQPLYSLPPKVRSMSNEAVALVGEMLRSTKDSMPFRPSESSLPTLTIGEGDGVKIIGFPTFGSVINDPMSRSGDVKVEMVHAANGQFDAL